MYVRNRSLPAALAAAALIVTLAACGSGGDGSVGASKPAAPTSGAPAPAVTKDAKLAAMVPASVASDGKIVFATDATYAPNEFTDTNGTTIIGMDVDLATAVATKLGLGAEFQNSPFSGILPGIQGNKFEAAISSLSVTDERTATVTMVSYFSAGTSAAVLKGNPDKIDPNDLCGKSVGVQAGTTQVDDLTARNKKCADAGKPAINVTELQAQTDVNLALQSKKVVAMLADSPVIQYAITQTKGAVEQVGQTYDTAPYGITIGKNQPDYAKAIQGAVQALITDGTYKAILDKWNVSNGAIPTSEIKG